MATRAACVLLLFGLTYCLPNLAQSQPQATPTPAATPTPSPTPTPEPEKNAGSIERLWQVIPLQKNLNSPMKGDVEILSDTMGVDFGPYLQRALFQIKKNWYNRIPEVARPPMMKKGNLIIRFSITKEGNVMGMVLDLPSGDIQLDRAAWGGITDSNPFEPLPKVFPGGFLTLRIKFVYNSASSSTPRDNVVPPDNKVQPTPK